MRVPLTGRVPLIKAKRITSKGVIYHGGTRFTKEDARKRRIKCDGYPVHAHNMTREQIADYFSGDTSITCLLCGKQFKVINKAHLGKIHNVTMDEYRTMYGLPVKRGLMCVESWNKKIEQGKSQYSPSVLKPYKIATPRTRKKARLTAFAIGARKNNMKNASNYLTKVNQKDAKKIRKMWETGKYTQKKIADKFCISQSSVWNIINIR